LPLKSTGIIMATIKQNLHRFLLESIQRSLPSLMIYLLLRLSQLIEGTRNIYEE